MYEAASKRRIFSWQSTPVMKPAMNKTIAMLKTTATQCLLTQFQSASKNSGTVFKPLKKNSEHGIEK